MKHMSSLSRQGVGMIVSLVLQYILGIITSLYVTFPEGEKGEKLWAFAGQQWPLALHMLIGLAILISSITILIRAVIESNKNWITASLIGTITVIITNIVGVLFIPTQQDIFSLIMAVGFIVALLAFGWGLYKDRPVLTNKK